MNLFDQYVNDVINGRIVTCEFVKLAVERHLDDLEDGKDRGIYFDREEAQIVLNKLRLIRHTAGELAGKPFDLQPFQAFIVGSIFGWKRDNGIRRFRKAYMELARKGGKSELLAGLVNLGLLSDEIGSQIYCAATTREQSLAVFRPAKVMAKYLKRDSKYLDKQLILRKHSISRPSTESFIHPLSADYSTMDGLNVSIATVDEYHQHKTDGVLKSLETAMGARREPLLLVISTAGFNREGPCFKYRNVIADILKGHKEDDSTFGIIYTLDLEDGDSWHDKNVWVKANPNIGKAPYWSYMEDKYISAVNEGYSSEIHFKTKNLNIWTTTSATWIPDDIWMASYTNFDKASLKGRECYGGLDLASIRDLTALVLFFPRLPGEKQDKIVCWFWCPQESVAQRVKDDGVPYDQWIRDGDMTATPGNVTDYNYIEHVIRGLPILYNLKSIAYDPYNSSHLVTNMIDEGIKMTPFSQGFPKMNAPVKELESLATKMELDHGGNPVLRWMCSNVDLKMSAEGNVKIDKGNSKEKVDGMVALAMAIGEYATFDGNKPSIYNTRGIRSV